jgi:L-malate glycosyltransferase
MRIAHVIDSMEVGGAEAVVLALCRLQAAAGHEVSVHCLFQGGALAAELAREGFRVCVHGPTSTARLTWRLYREFRRWKPNVVHCHNKAATVYAAPAARAAGSRAVFSTRHGMAAPPYSLRKDFKYWLCAALFCDRVVAVCDLARENMSRNAGPFARHVITIRNGAYPARSAGKGPVPAAEAFTLVTVGRLVPAKNYGVLLRSLALALSHVPDLKLWMVGDGREATALKTLAAELGIAEKVEFFGEQSAVGDWLSRADLFVLSSISEGLPISILEAMAAGLPTVVTDVGGMPEVLALSGAGEVVPAGSVESLAQAITAYASRRQELETLKERAFSCYTEHFRPERMAEDYLNLYQSCLSRDRAAV